MSVSEIKIRDSSDFEKALTVLYTETDTTRALKRKICDLKKLDYGVLMHLSDANQRELDDDRKVADQISNGDAIYWDPKKNAHLGSLTVGSYTIRGNLVTDEAKQTNTIKFRHMNPAANLDISENKSHIKATQANTMGDC